MTQYFCRVCDSSNGWTKPSAAASETSASHYGNFGFAYEEWNFNPALSVTGWQHGWLEGFKPGPGKRKIESTGPHEVAMYVRRGGSNLFVGKLLACEYLTSSPIHVTYPPILAADANLVGANIVLVAGGQWSVTPVIRAPRMSIYTHTPVSNVRFRLEDVQICAMPIRLGISYTRFGALKVNGNPILQAEWARLP